MRIAYADPPYVGQAKKHYGKEASYAGEVDHAQLAEALAAFDGWALSASSPSLHVVLPLFPDCRIGAWVKPFAIFKPGVNPGYCWEPVLFKPARSGKDRLGGRKAPTVRDWVSANITLKKGLSGVKPPAFCEWLFELLGVEPEDEFVDMFPGSGAVTAALGAWNRRRTPADDGLCYILDTRQTTGNCAIWWAAEGLGYACDLSKAWRVPADHHLSRQTDVLVPCALVEANAVRHARADEHWLDGYRRRRT